MYSKSANEDAIRLVKLLQTQDYLKPQVERLNLDPRILSNLQREIADISSNIFVAVRDVSEEDDRLLSKLKSPK